MANNIMQQLRSNTTAKPSTLLAGQLAWSNSSQLLYSGNPDGSNTVTPIGGNLVFGVLGSNAILVTNSTGGMNNVAAANFTLMGNSSVAGTISANGAGNTGSSGFVLFSGGPSSNVYWASAGAVGVNTQAAYTWTNTHIFQGNSTATSFLTVGANLTMNSVNIEWIGNSTTSPTLSIANTGAIISGNSTSTATTIQVNLANSVGNVNITPASFAIANSTGTTTVTPVSITVAANATSNISIGNSTVNTVANSTTVIVANVFAGATVNATAFTAGANGTGTGGFDAGANYIFIGNNTVNSNITTSLQAVANATGTVTQTPVSIIVAANASSNISVGNSTVNVQINSTAIVVPQLLANGAAGTAGWILYSGGAGVNSYWAAASGSGINTQASYTFTNTEIFQGNSTATSFLTVGANLTMNTISITWIGNSTTSPTVSIANTGAFTAGNSTSTATTIQFNAANSVGNVNITPVSITLSNATVAVLTANETGVFSNVQVNAAYFTTTGTVNTATVFATGQVNAAYFTTTGTVNTATVYATGLVNAANFTTTGTVNTSTVYATGLVNAANFVTTGTVNTGTVFATGQVNASYFTTTGTVNTGTVFATGQVNAAYFTTTGSTNTGVLNASTSANVGGNVQITTQAYTIVGNTTTQATLNLSSNSTVTGLYIGNSSVTGAPQIFIANSLGNTTLTTTSANIGGTILTVNSTVMAYSGGNVVATSANMSIQNMTISGNLTVSGTVTTLNTSDLIVNSNFIEMADNNTTTDVVDSGWFSPAGNSTVRWYSGMVRQAASSNSTSPYFILFGANNTNNPNTASTVTANYIGTLQAYLTTGNSTVGSLFANSTVLNITANSTVSSTIAANSLTLTTALGAGSGGTGKLSAGYAAGDILYAATGSPSALTSLAIPGSAANGQVLQITNNLPAYGVLDAGTF